MRSPLLAKYNVPGPRYTSYPTVPYWEHQRFCSERFSERLAAQSAQVGATDGLSLYVHLPYCESLCTFCGCNKRITKNHQVEAPYVEALLREWRLVRGRLGGSPRIAELHLGGGTPSFFSPAQLTRLVSGLFEDSQVLPDGDLSFEGHPNSTGLEHLTALHALGFRRVSYGVQDLSERVQVAIHRRQPFAAVERATRQARQAGYVSVCHDLVYGLPFQTEASMADTIEQVLTLRPDRIAFYSYAHVPWVKGVGQRGFKDEHLPSPELKLRLFETGRALFLQAGYVEIGMDHFALPEEALSRALGAGTLHRNFMGYTTSRSSVLAGLGASAISDAWTAFAQNEKNVDHYLARVNAGEAPLQRGHLLTDEDLRIRRLILEVMCQGKARWRPEDFAPAEYARIESALENLAADGLLVRGEGFLQVTPAGRPFLRNICMAFDLRLMRAQPEGHTFSQTV